MPGRFADRRAARGPVIESTIEGFRRAGSSRSILMTVMLVVTIALAACSAPGRSSAPSADASASTAMASEPTTSPSPIASQSASSGMPPAEVGPAATIHDPDLALYLPTNWKAMSISNFRTIVEASVTGSSKAMQGALDALLRDIDNGSVRLVASGTAGFGAWSATMTVQVNTGDESLEAAVARIEKRSDGLVDRTGRDARPVTLEIGEAIRSVSTYAVEPGSGAGSVPARVIEYVVRLVDGRTLWVMATAPEAAEGFAALIDGAVGSIRVQ